MTEIPTGWQGSAVETTHQDGSIRVHASLILENEKATGTPTPLISPRPPTTAPTQVPVELRKRPAGTCQPKNTLTLTAGSSRAPGHEPRRTGNTIPDGHQCHHNKSGENPQNPHKSSNANPLGIGGACPPSGTWASRPSKSSDPWVTVSGPGPPSLHPQILGWGTPAAPPRHAGPATAPDPARGGAPSARTDTGAAWAAHESRPMHAAPRWGSIGSPQPLPSTGAPARCCTTCLT